MNEFRTEDYKFHARLTWTQKAQIEVPCKLFLPDRIGGDLRLIFIVNNETYHRIATARPCQLSGELGKGPGSVKIVADDVRIGGGEYRSWGEGLDEGYLLGYPRRLQVIRRTAGAHHGLKGAFNLTRSLHLEPRDLRRLHSDGSMVWDRGERFQFDLADGTHLTFDHEYRYDTSKVGETRMWPELVARIEVPPPSRSDLETLLPAMDELLLLVSLAEGKRCVCLGAAWINEEEFVTLYRLDRSIPSARPNPTVNEFLIDHSDFRYYLETSYRNL